MRLAFAPSDPGSYRAHALHGESRIWQETNCYVDLWIEVLHALGHDPHGMLGCAFTSAFEGDQWLFFKPAAHDLFALYGVDLQELTIYRPLVDHLTQQLTAGHLVLVEVDAYHLPDTRGVSYRTQHKKTTIAVAGIDADALSLWYFHNGGYFRLDGADFAALFAPSALPPYTEFVRIGSSPALRDDALVARARALLMHHLARAPRENPVARYRQAFADQLATLGASSPDSFHEYAFATLRQLGAAFELGAAYLGWLHHHDAHPALAAAMGSCARIAEHAKTLQFKAARAVMRGRGGVYDELFDAMAADWDGVYEVLRRNVA